MLVRQLAPAAHDRGRDPALEVRVQRHRLLGLAAIARNHPGQGREPRERLVEQRVAVAAPARLGDELLEPRVERLRRRGRRDREEERERQEERMGRAYRSV